MVEIITGPRKASIKTKTTSEKQCINIRRPYPFISLTVWLKTRTTSRELNTIEKVVVMSPLVRIIARIVISFSIHV